MRLNKEQHTFELEPYYMATDNLILLNQKITTPTTKGIQHEKQDFSDYLGIYKFLLKHKN